MNIHEPKMQCTQNSSLQLFLVAATKQVAGLHSRAKQHFSLCVHQTDWTYNNYRIMNIALACTLVTTVTWPTHCSCFCSLVECAFPCITLHFLLSVFITLHVLFLFTEYVYGSLYHSALVFINLLNITVVNLTITQPTCNYCIGRYVIIAVS